MDSISTDHLMVVWSCFKSPNSKISRQTRKYFRYQSGNYPDFYAINFIPLIPILDLSYANAVQQPLLQLAAQGSDELTVSSTDAP